jgi:hypothetical protein
MHYPIKELKNDLDGKPHCKIAKFKEKSWDGEDFNLVR